MKPIYIFDLDNTVIDSRHRTPNNPDGTLNLCAYKSMHNRDNVFKDTLLPLAYYMQELFANGETVYICTAREMADFDYEYLSVHNLRAHRIMSRNNIEDWHYRLSDGQYKVEHLRHLTELPHYATRNKYMWDDSMPVINAVSNLPNFTAYLV